MSDGPLANDEELGWSRQSVEDSLDGMSSDDTTGRAEARGLLYVGDCIRKAVDALIAARSSELLPIGEVDAALREARALIEKHGGQK